MPTVHIAQHTIGACLYRQVKIRHEFRLITQRFNEFIIHIARVRGGETNTVNPANQCNVFNQLAKAPLSSIWAVCDIGIHILADHRNFAYAFTCEVTRLIDDLVNRTRDFRAARIRHNTKCAELIAALLDGQKGAKAFDFSVYGQLVKFL